MSERRVALVTGAGSGIGRATAVRLAASGWLVIVCDRDEAAAEAAAAALLRAGGAAEAAPLDVADLAAVAALAKSLNGRHGGVEAVVCGAGISGHGKPFAEVDVAGFDAMIDVHVRGHFFLLQALVPAMRARRDGRIVFVSSMFALRGSPNMPHYSAAKGALLGLMKALATELGPDGIRVNAVAPGLVRTAMTEKSLAAIPGEFERRAAATPLGRLTTPEEVADTIAYLISDAASALTGQTLSPSSGEAFTG